MHWIDPTDIHTLQNALKGAEKGYFQFGGSTGILLFERHMVTISDDLLGNMRDGIETCVLNVNKISTIAR